jgi:manganese transport protein
MLLLWVLVFAVVATIVLQEMSARLALASGKGLVESLSALAPPWGNTIAWSTGLAAVFGVIAFEAGNLSGAGLGLAAMSSVEPALWTGAVAIVAAGLLLTGRYRLIEQVLMVCVALMGVVFVVTAVAVAPDPMRLLRGLFLPRIPADGALTVLALVGTTVVPYNIYLHASVVRERWSDTDALPAARRDLVLAVSVGGLISAAIVITAAASLPGTVITSGADMAPQLEPLLGHWARLMFGLGLATAGLTSAITAPLAAAYIMTGLVRADSRLSGRMSRGVMIGVVGTGALFALSGVQPVQLIVFAQAANGLILPLIALALLLALNNRARLGEHVNGPIGNAIGLSTIALCTVLAARVLFGWG